MKITYLLSKNLGPLFVIREVYFLPWPIDVIPEPIDPFVVLSCSSSSPSKYAPVFTDLQLRICNYLEPIRGIPLAVYRL